MQEGDFMSKIDDWTTGDGLILVQGWARDGLTNEQIANNMGIHISTLYDWKKKSAEFSDILKRSKAVVDYEVENALLKNAMNGNVTAQIFWLKNRKKLEWREKVEVPLNGKELSNVEKLLEKIEQEATK